MLPLHDFDTKKITTDNVNPMSVPFTTLEMDGITYVKILETKQRYKYVTPSGKKDMRLWLCAKKDASLPAELFLVPEIS